MFIGLLVVIGSLVVASQNVSASPELRLPFDAGEVLVLSDETYGESTPHPTNRAIAFDFNLPGLPPDTPVLAVGDGSARVACVHRSGSAALLLQVDGIEGDFVYIHIDVDTIPARFDEDHWEPVRQGAHLGDLFPDTIQGVAGDRCYQFSTGPHLHLDFPSEDIRLDGLVYAAVGGPGDNQLVVSTNQLFDPRCVGEEPTIVGTRGDDVLVGTAGRDIIMGLEGDDTIRGLGGDDLICGGFGDDTIYGGQGFDVLHGAQGHDVLYASDGATASAREDTLGSRIFGGRGDDTIIGSNRWDRAQGGLGDDELYGFEGRDTLRGGPGADLLDGGGSLDDLHGGLGQDNVRH